MSFVQRKGRHLTVHYRFSRRGPTLPSLLMTVEETLLDARASPFNPYCGGGLRYLVLRVTFHVYNKEVTCMFFACFASLRCQVA